MTWGYEQEQPDNITVKELTRLCTRMKELREEKKAQAEKLSDIESEIKSYESKVLAYLEEYGMKNFSGEFGTVSRTRRYSVKQPSTPEAKSEFFDYLRGQGIFEELVSVNSRTLQSYVKQEIEAKKEEGIEDFVPPGLEAPSITETISLRKA